MKRQELETLVINYLFDKAKDPEALLDELQNDLNVLKIYSDYPSMDLDDYWNNDLKFYDFEDSGNFLISFLEDSLKLKTFKNWVRVTKPFLIQIDTFIKLLKKKGGLTYGAI